MGNNQITYSVPLGEKKEGETHVYRHPNFAQGLNNSFKGSQTLQEIFIKNCKKYPMNNLLGTQVSNEQNIKSYIYKTYSECFEIAEQIGSGIIKLNLISKIIQYEGLHMKMVGVFSKNREEWMLLEYANFLYGNTMIPLYDTLGPESIPYVLQQSEIETIFCSAQSIVTLLKVKNLGKLKNVVTFDVLKEETIQQLKEMGLHVLQWQEVIDAGAANIAEFCEVKPNDVFTFSYTSGTTGNPKGVMITHLNLMVTMASPESQEMFLNEDDVHLSYLPLPHVFERVFALSVMGYGAKLCFYSGDVLKLNLDMALAKPTLFVSVPRLYQRLNQVIKEKLNSLQGFKKKMVDHALETKTHNLRKDGSFTHKIWDRVVFGKTKEVFGGNVRYLITASAPLSGEIVDFLKIVVCCPFVEGYGSTETTGGSFMTHPRDSNSNHIGGPLSHTEFKLVDLVDMKYTSLDKDEDGQPCPRGEICLRGPSIFAGYFQDKVKTQEVVDKDGWFHSGDVGRVLANGSVQIIGRKKEIFKLSQGEYIAPKKIEDIYAKVKGVSEVFVYGDSKQHYCVAIIVPKKAVLEGYAKDKNITGEYKELCSNKEINEIYLKEVQSMGKAEGLNGMENVKKIYLEPESFIDHGCMTDTQKLKRHEAEEEFKEVLEELYKE